MIIPTIGFLVELNTLNQIREMFLTLVQYVIIDFLASHFWIVFFFFWLHFDQLSVCACPSSLMA